MINPKAPVKNNPLFGKLVLKSASVKINNPIIPIANAIFCLFEISTASGFAKDML